MFLRIAKPSKPSKPPAEVLPDWKRDTAVCQDKARQELTEQQLAQDAHQAVKQLLSSHVMSERAEKSKAAAGDVGKKAVSERLANREFLRCLDHQWSRGAGVALADFLPGRRLRALQATEERYYIEMPCPITQEPRKRSCIHNKATGERFIEVPHVIVDGARQPKLTWHCCQDMGPVGWSAMTWFFLKAGARGTQIWDRLHRLHNDRLDGISEAGLTMVRLEWAPVLNMRLGPFQKSGNHQLLMQAAREMFQRLDHTNAVYAHLYESICHDMGCHTDTDFATPCHMAAVWKRLEGLMCNAARGEAMKLNRWWSWELRAASIIKGNGGIHALFMLLIYVGYRRGWWKTYEQCPLSSHFEPTSEEAPGDEGDNDVEGAPAAEDPQAAGPTSTQAGLAEPADKRVTVAKGRQQMQTTRKKLSNIMLYACTLMSKPLSIRLLRGLCMLPEPLHEVYAREYQLLQTRSGTLTMHQELVDNGYCLALHGVFCRLISPILASELGFSSITSACEGADQDALLARHMWKLAWGTVASMALTGLTYSAIPPLMLIGLTSPDPEHVSSLLKKLGDMWDVLLMLERSALSNPECHRFVCSLRFPLEHFTREVLVQLSESDFRSVPGFVMEDLVAFGSGINSTLIIEKMFNHLRGVERSSQNGQVGPLAAWHEAAHGTLLKEFDRPPVQIDSFAKSAAAPAMPSSTFMPAGASACSLPDELMDTLHEKPASWPAQSGPQMKLAGLRWLCALHHCGDWNAMNVSWLSLLQQPGTLTKKRGAKRGLVVLKSSAWGFLGWQVFLKTVDGKIVLELGPPDKTLVKYNVVADPAEWQSLVVQCLPPSHGAWSVAKSSLGMEVACLGKPQPLLTAAAESGFKGMTVVYLRKLLKHLQVEQAGRKPATEVQLVEALTRHVLPSSSEGDLDTYLQRRDAAEEGEELDGQIAQVLLEHDVMQDMADELDDGEAATLMAEQAELNKKRVQKLDIKRHEMSSLLAGRAKGVTDDAPVAKMPVVLVPGRGLTQKEAKPYAPPNCYLIKDTVRHLRWQVRAPWLQPSHSKTFSASDAGTDCSALLYCLQQAWRRHTALTGEACPWDLDTDLF